MGITTRSEYGMRAMIVLAEQLGEELVSTAELARIAHIPRKYLEQLLRDLKGAGLVVAQAGARGGYRLSRPSEQITAGQIVRSLDQTDIMSCVGAEPRKPCDRIFGCSLRPLWQRLQDAMHEVLDATSLDQLAFNPCIATPTHSDSSEVDDIRPTLAIQQRPVYQI
ncbi:MAG: Rrf2 family cysteine metabolism transcriptional repressor [Myxococcota bacterium]|jgi:Rrf2 family cysteine metabolism transcriptional repressor